MGIATERYAVSDVCLSLTMCVYEKAKVPLMIRAPIVIRFGFDGSNHDPGSDCQKTRQRSDPSGEVLEVEGANDEDGEDDGENELTSNRPSGYLLSKVVKGTSAFSASEYYNYIDVR